jgi:hypothetical protein
MVKVNLTPELDFLPKFFPENAEKFDVQALVFCLYRARRYKNPLFAEGSVNNAMFATTFPPFL